MIDNVIDPYLVLASSFCLVGYVLGYLLDSED